MLNRSLEDFRRIRHWREEVIQSVQRALNDALTEDILGSDWRRKTKQQELKEQADELSEVALLREVELKSLLKSKALTERDVQILWARVRKVPHAELAAKLAIKPEAARTAYHRAIEKLKKLAS